MRHTEAQHGRWRGAEGSTAMSGGEGSAVLVDGAAGIHLRAPGLHGSTHEAPAKPGVSLAGAAPAALNRSGCGGSGTTMRGRAAAVDWRRR